MDYAGGMREKGVRPWESFRREAAGCSVRGWLGGRWVAGPKKEQSLPVGAGGRPQYLACSCVLLGPHTALYLFFKNYCQCLKAQGFFFFF